MMNRNVRVFLPVLAAVMANSSSGDPMFSAPGELEKGSGQGVKDQTIYFKNIRFPLELAPAYANSQVYRKGGNHGPAGKQCDASNYSYPWKDDFCESRGWDMPLCPTKHGHQGQDIRPSTCKKKTYWAVAVEDGVIAQVGTYSVTLQTAQGTLYRYLHLQMDELAVKRLEKVKRGDKIGLVSDFFGDSSTTIHLHFDIKDSVVVGQKKMTVFLPPYSSLVESYKKLLAGNP